MEVVKIIVWMLLLDIAGGQPPAKPDNDFSSPCKSCYCDELCVLRRDCCDGYTPPNEPYLFDLAQRKLKFTCVESPKVATYGGITCGFGVFMVTKCPDTFNNNKLRLKCENNRTTDISGNVPVSSIKSQVIYKNKYCAWCNGEKTFSSWKIAKDRQILNNLLVAPPNESIFPVSCGTVYSERFCSSSTQGSLCNLTRSCSFAPGNAPINVEDDKRCPSGQKYVYWENKCRKEKSP